MSERIRQKLDETKDRFQELLRESEKVVTPKPEAFLQALNAFQEAGYSLRKLLEKKEYQWKTWGTEADRNFITFMDDQRGQAVHHKGIPDTDIQSVPDLMDRPGTQHSDPAYGSHLFGPLGAQPAMGHKPVYRFSASGEEVIKCCTRYLALLERLVTEFS